MSNFQADVFRLMEKSEGRARGGDSVYSLRDGERKRA